ncbi:MAG TPA: PAS domain S-box protein [Gemmataceae bacterium]|nr:PAS domain S-box protein [Gemmataceae bacterium]
MHALRINLLWIVLGGGAALAAGFFVWTTVAGVGLAAAAMHLLSSGAGVCFLALTLAALALHWRGRQAESAEARFQSLLDAAPDAMLITRRDGRILLANARAEGLFGYGREELAGWPLTALVRQGVGGPSGAWGATATHTGSMPETPDFVGRLKGGREIAVEVSFSPLETREDLFLIHVIRDVTEAREQERRRATRHAARRVLAEAAAARAAAPELLRCVGEILGWDAGAIWLEGRPGGGLRRAAAWDAADGPSWEACGPGPEGEAAHAPPDREPAWVIDPGLPGGQAPAGPGWRTTVTVPVAHGGDAFGVLELHSREPRPRDDALLETLATVGTYLGQFLQRDRAEEAVRQSEARKAAVLEASPDAIITLDHEGRVLELNPAAEAIFGRPRAAVLGREAAEVLFPPHARDGFRQEMGRRGPGDGGRPGGARATEACHADGRAIPVEVTITRIRTTGEPLFTAYIRDLSERKQAEEALRQTEEKFLQAQKMEAVGRLAGGVAHDFNNLLTVIMGYTEAVLADLGADHPAREMLDEVARAGERAAALTRQLLAFSRKQMLVPEVLDLNAVVADFQKMIGRLIGEDIQLLTLPGDGLRPVKVDPGQLEQVLMNLVVNARDAMPQGGRLTIETANADLDEDYARACPEVQPGPYVLLAVTDTGCGMDEATRARIFEPFFTTKERGKGTGLGLATVYGIVRQSGGHIAVYSEPGKGTAFKVYLPAAAGAAAGAEEAPGGHWPACGVETVLLVEDEEGVRSLARQVLERYGYTVLTAGDGEEGLAVCRHHPGPIHLLLTDVVMPKMNGATLARQAALARPGMKTLYMSGFNDSILLNNGALSGDIDCVQKPFTADVLVRAVREVLDRPAPEAGRPERRAVGLGPLAGSPGCACSAAAQVGVRPLAPLRCVCGPGEDERRG